MIDQLVGLVFGDWLGAGLALSAALLTRWWLVSVRNSGAGPSLPPGPPAWPVLGNLPAILAQGDYAYEYFRKLSDKHGGSALVTVRLGPVSFVVINSLDGLRNTLVKYADEFAGRPRTVVSGITSDGFQDVAFADYGRGWAVRRRLAAAAAKTLASRDLVEEVVADEVRLALDAMLAGEPAGDAGAGAGFPLRRALSGLTYGVISRLIFGASMPAHEKALLATNIRELADLMGRPLFQEFLPYSVGSRVPSPGLFLLKRKFSEMTAQVASKVSEHRRHFDPDCVGDIVDAMLLAQLDLNAKGEDLSGVFEDSHVTITIADLFFAGSDTTTFVLNWVFLYLARHQHVQDKMRQKIREATGDRAVGLGDRPALPYVEAVISEVMRLRPVTPLGLFHSTTRQVTVEAFGNTPASTLPKGMLVFPNIWACHHDPATWGPDVAEFRPERFLSPDGSEFVKHDGLVPFSLGRRQCLGEQIARQDLFLVVAGIIQRARIKGSTSAPVSVERDPKGGSQVMMPPDVNVVAEKIL